MWLQGFLTEVIRAYGGYLGLYERRRTWTICEKSGGGDHQPLYPRISEWGNLIRVMPDRLII